MLREINQGTQQDEIEHHEDLEMILKRKAQREERKVTWEKDEHMKRLRQQNAMEFFRKIKVRMMIGFREAIWEARRAENYARDNLLRLFSCCTLNNLKMLSQIK